MSDFPTIVTTNVDPTAGNTLHDVPHAEEHQSHNAEIKATQTKIGTGSSTPTAGKVLRASGTGTSAWAQVDPSTDMTTLTSATLRSLLTDETGTGVAVFGTSPAITTPSITTSINDANGNEVFKTPAAISAVNEFTAANAATGSAPVMSVTGGDTNIDYGMTWGKGTGQLKPSGHWDGWISGVVTPDTVTYNGNRSYSLVYNGTDLTGFLSNGMRLKTTRTVSAPTQCTNLNGTTQYWVKTSPNKMTFTDDFTVSAWVKPTSYADGVIASRYNGTSGWYLRMDASGQVQLDGFNAGSSNFSRVITYQSLPLNKWTHVTVQLDMSSFTATPTTSYVMFDGLDVSASVSRGGTNPTALVQAGNLEIGGNNGGAQPFPGKIAQVAIFNAKVTQATMRGYISQGLSGSETSIASAYSFNNSVTDLNTTTPNDLSVGGGAAVATNADSPFAQDDTGTPSGITDFSVITSKTFSTNTTLTVQVPEGCTIPTSGGVSAVSYSTQKVPYGFPDNPNKWALYTLQRTSTATTSNATFGSYNSGGYKLTVPIGSWRIGQRHGSVYNATTTDVFFALSGVVLTGMTTAQAAAVCRTMFRITSPSAASTVVPAYVDSQQILSSQTDYIIYTLGATTSAGIAGDGTQSEIFAEFGYL